MTFAVDWAEVLCLLLFQHEVTFDMESESDFYLWSNASGEKQNKVCNYVTLLTACILKHDQDTQKVKRNAYLN